MGGVGGWVGACVRACVGALEEAAAGGGCKSRCPSNSNCFSPLHPPSQPPTPPTPPQPRTHRQVDAPLHRKLKLLLSARHHPLQDLDCLCVGDSLEGGGGHLGGRVNRVRVCGVVCVCVCVWWGWGVGPLGGRSGRAHPTNRPLPQSRTHTQTHTYSLKPQTPHTCSRRSMQPLSIIDAMKSRSGRQCCSNQEQQ